MNPERTGPLRRAWRAARAVGASMVPRLVAGRPDHADLAPVGPPIEQIAAHLRRVLWQHDAFARSDDTLAHGRRVWALEAAISYRATQAARALGVPHRDEPALGGF